MFTMGQIFANNVRCFSSARTSLNTFVLPRQIYSFTNHQRTTAYPSNHVIWVPNLQLGAHVEQLGTHVGANVGPCGNKWGPMWYPCLNHAKADDTHCSLIPDIGLMLISALVVSAHTAQLIAGCCVWSCRVLHVFFSVLQGIVGYCRVL